MHIRSVGDCQLPVFHAICAIGTQLCFYRCTSNRVSQRRIERSDKFVNYTASEVRWTHNLETDAGKNELLFVAQDIKRGCGALIDAGFSGQSTGLPLRSSFPSLLRLEVPSTSSPRWLGRALPTPTRRHFLPASRYWFEAPAGCRAYDLQTKEGIEGEVLCDQTGVRGTRRSRFVEGLLRLQAHHSFSTDDDSMKSYFCIYSHGFLLFKGAGGIGICKTVVFCKF